jgi:Flp pilus assembly protein TadD
VAKILVASMAGAENLRAEPVSTVVAPTASVIEPTKPRRLAAQPKETLVADKSLLEQANDALANGRVAEACALGEKALEDPSASPLVHKFLGKCSMRLGEQEKGISHYRRYLDLSPSGPDAVFVKEMIR